MALAVRRTHPGVPAEVVAAMRDVSSGIDDGGVRVAAAGIEELIALVGGDAVPAATIVNVGALMHVERFLSEPFDANRALQRNAVELLCELAEHDGRVRDDRVQAQFLGHSLVKHLARHLRHADQEIATLAGRALSWVASRDRLRFSTEFDDAWLHEHGVLQTLADDSVSVADSGAFNTLKWMWPGDRGGADAARAFPMLKRVLQRAARDARTAAVLFCSFAAVYNADRTFPTDVVDSMVESGIVSRVAEFLAANAGGRGDPCATCGAWALLWVVAESGNREHVRHAAAESGLLRALPAMLASAEGENYDSAMAFLRWLVDDDDATRVRRVLDAAPGLVPALARRMREGVVSKAEAGNGTRDERAAQCLQAMARSAALPQAVRLVEEGAPKALVAAAVVVNARYVLGVAAFLAASLGAIVLADADDVVCLGCALAVSFAAGLCWLSERRPGNLGRRDR